MTRFRKRILTYTITCVILMMAVLGCSMEDTQEDRLKDIDFTVVGEQQQPEALRDIIAEKSAEPFQISYTLGTEMYIAIG